LLTLALQKDVPMTEAVYPGDKEEVNLYANLNTAGDKPPTGTNLWGNYVEKKDGSYSAWDSHSFNTQVRLLLTDR
jgi:hypothetical protein